MSCLQVKLPEREYAIHIEKGALPHIGEKAISVIRGKLLVIITDDTVGPIYLNTVTESLTMMGFSVKTIEIPAGETSKSVPMLESVYERLMACGLTRADGIVALGGGVVGDLAGFAAATILRGVDLIQIPTTLLAQVDSSVGGKVAVNLNAGKNLAGAFYQPKLVVIDPLCLNSLTDADFSSGMAEVIKYGAIFDEKLFDTLSGKNGRQEVMEGIEDIIYTCCDLKRRVVEEDEKDTGNRMLLNFGHTLGHVYEKAYHYETYTHGQAVAAGMCAAAKIGEAIGVTEKGTEEKIRELVKKYHLPDHIPADRDQFESVLGLDKKSQGEDIEFILLKRIGVAFRYKMKKSELLQIVFQEVAT